MPGNGPRAQIMLARCEAAKSSFAGCREALATVFHGERQTVADELKGAFVFCSLGMRADALRTILELASCYPEYPTNCLLLGDIFRADGNAAKAKKCWQLAVKRDRLRGALAMAAKRQLERLAKRRPKSVPESDARGPAA